VALLTGAELAFLQASRRAVLATQGPQRPRLVPICFAIAQSEDPDGGLRLYSAIDEKPKRSADPQALGRVRDIGRSPLASLLVDRWDEDWSRLAWLRLDGTALLVPPDPTGAGEHVLAVSLLRARYVQYAGQALEESLLIRLTVEHAVSWGL
jgi:PPOX class probable F420-dependent enzyme